MDCGGLDSARLLHMGCGAPQIQIGACGRRTFGSGPQPPRSPSCAVGRRLAPPVLHGRRLREIRLKLFSLLPNLEAACGPSTRPPPIGDNLMPFTHTHPIYDFQLDGAAYLNALETGAAIEITPSTFDYFLRVLPPVYMNRKMSIDG